MTLMEDRYREVLIHEVGHLLTEISYAQELRPDMKITVQFSGPPRGYRGYNLSGVTYSKSCVNMIEDAVCYVGGWTMEYVCGYRKKLTYRKGSDYDKVRMIWKEFKELCKDNKVNVPHDASFRRFLSEIQVEALKRLNAYEDRVRALVEAMYYDLESVEDELEEGGFLATYSNEYLRRELPKCELLNKNGKIML